ERVRGRGLVVLVVRHDPAAVIGRHHLRRLEMLAREVRLARAGHADQHHEPVVGNADLGHRVNTPICVGGPTSGSSPPTGTYRTRYPCAAATRSAHARNSARVHSNRWSGWRIAPGASPS